MARGLSVVMACISGLMDGIRIVGNLMAKHWNVVGPVMAAVNFMLTTWVLALLPGLAGKLWQMAAPLANIVEMFSDFWGGKQRILMIVAGITLLVIAIKALGLSFADVTAFIAGLFGTIASVLGSILSWCGNLAVLILNIILSVFKIFSLAVEGFVSVVCEQVLSAARLIGKLLDPVLNTNIAPKAQEAGDGMWKKLRLSFENPTVKLPWQFETSDAYEQSQGWSAKWREFGQNITDKMSGFFDGGAGAFGGLDTYGSAAADYYGAMADPGRSQPANYYGPDALSANLANAVMPADYYGGALDPGEAVVRTTGNDAAGRGMLGAYYNGESIEVNRINELGRVEGGIKIADEEMELLRELVRASAVTNFISIAPQANTYVETVRENADVKQISGEMVRRLAGEFLTEAQRAYAR